MNATEIERHRKLASDVINRWHRGEWRKNYKKDKPFDSETIESIHQQTLREGFNGLSPKQVSTLQNTDDMFAACENKSSKPAAQRDLPIGSLPRAVYEVVVDFPEQPPAENGQMKRNSGLWWDALEKVTQELVDAGCRDVFDVATVLRHHKVMTRGPVLITPKFLDHAFKTKFTFPKPRTRSDSSIVENTTRQNTRATFVESTDAAIDLARSILSDEKLSPAERRKFAAHILQRETQATA